MARAAQSTFEQRLARIENQEVSARALTARTTWFRKPRKNAACIGT
ncbi:hypothetical protein [Tateyamaria sp.]